ncbi:DNA sulfur modification protein DndE [Methylophaga thalassica]|uniref:DNA sulfur modification protein DndE n=1 Tax=Methylophaga aminisulfidivorans TaxID=230105 RepID=UPI0024E231D6|nr:DNA sulfur modification protein DndE [Methylophaga aminisulfidivorans]
MHGIEIIRLSEKQKQQLIILKRKTGIENWNVLCRWALCTSLADNSPPPKENIPSDSNIEMSWKTFSGEHSDLYLALILHSYKNYSNRDLVNLYAYIKSHISRGISSLLTSNI